jgi:hypothetical protein
LLQWIEQIFLVGSLNIFHVSLSKINENHLRIPRDEKHELCGPNIVLRLCWDLFSRETLRCGFNDSSRNAVLRFAQQRTHICRWRQQKKKLVYTFDGEELTNHCDKTSW